MRINNKYVASFYLITAIATQCIGDNIHTNQIRAEGLQADRDFVTNNAALNNTLNIKPASYTGYLKSLDDQSTRERAQAEALKAQQMQEIDARWANDMYKAHLNALKGQNNQVISFNAWAREYYSQLRKQAQDGNAVAMYTYAWLLSPLDPERLAWYRTAAEAGHVGAISAQGWLFFDESVRKHQPPSQYFEGIHDERGSIIAFKLGALQNWTRAADNDDPSALAMCALIYWNGGEEENTGNNFMIPKDREKALRYLDRLEKIGALTLHDIIAPYLYDPSFFSLFGGSVHPTIKNAYRLRDEGGSADDQRHSNIYQYSDYSPTGMYPKTQYGGEELHIEMIKREIYPTLWHTRQAAMKGDKSAIERLIGWGKNHYIETNLNPTLKNYNQWMIQSNLGPSGNTYAFPFAPAKNEQNLVNPDKPGFYMNERELAYWTQKLQ